MVGTPGGVPLPEVFGGFSRASVELWQNLTALFTDDDHQALELVAEIASMDPGTDKVATIARGLSQIADRIDSGPERVAPILAKLGA